MGREARERREKHPNWGGKREGAGGVAFLEDAVVISLRLPSAVVGKLNSRAQVENTTRSAVVRQILDNNL
jgi:hypothetical protein